MTPRRGGGCGWGAVVGVDDINPRNGTGVYYINNIIINYYYINNI